MADAKGDGVAVGSILAGTGGNKQTIPIDIPTFDVDFEPAFVVDP